MTRPAIATVDLLKVRWQDGKRIGVIVLKEDEQIRGGAQRLLNLAKDVAVDRLVVASARDGVFSLRSFLPGDTKPETIPDQAARLAVAALRRVELWPARSTLQVDVSGKRIECGHNEKAPAPDRCKIWSVATLDEDLVHLNAEARQMLIDCFGSGMGVIPFVGAGLSAEFHFPQWAELLTTLASVKSKPAVQRLVTAGRYEKAAQILYEGGRAADRLQAGIMATFKRRLPANAFVGSAVSLLPHLTCGPVVTTNFDQVLERVFERAKRPFKGCPILGSDPDSFVPAIQRNEHVLFKIHGDCENRRSLTLTLKSYADSYGRTHTSKARESLRAMLPLLLTNRPVLFLGCSLTSDRTLALVKDVHDRHAGIWHYAIVAAPYDVKAFEKRRDQLLGLGIQPLWFPAGEFEYIRDHLRDLLEDISVESIYETPARASHPSSHADPVVRPPAGPTGAWPAPPPPAEPPSSQDIPIGLVDAVKAARTGRVVFFLGAGAASDLLGNEFYERLADAEGISAFGRARADAAQHIVDLRKRSTLVAAIKGILETLRPSRTHRFLARLGKSAGGTAPPGSGPRLIIMTTNQDRGLEVAFEHEDRPYHLFVYQPHGDYEGLFLYRLPSGDVRVVRKPENIIEVGYPLPIIVKLNGGISWLPDVVPDTFSATNRDFYSLAARIPDALPACLLTELQQRSLLFLAHGLDAPDVEEIIRYRHAFAQERSWAVQWSKDPACLGPDPNEVAYWRQLGLELLWQDVDEFIRILEQPVPPR